MIELHKRFRIVEKAFLELGRHVMALLDHHKLTYHELVGILLDQARTWTKYGIRTERHPDDSGKKGDEA